MMDHPTLIAIFGATGTGKTTFVNNASGGNLPVGDDLTSCTQNVAASNPFQINGREVQLVDTPGFDDTELSDTEILQRISGYLSTTYEKGVKLTGIIYLHRITDPRMGGISRRTFQVFRELCGQRSLSNVLIVTTMWSDPPNNPQIKRERQLKEDVRYYQPALQAGAQMARCLRKDAASAREIVRMVVDKNPVVMKVQEELVDEKKGFYTTGAAQVLGKELVEMQKRHEEEMNVVKEELRQAKENNDAQAQEELHQFLMQAKVESARLAKEIETLRHGFEEERKRWEQRINDAVREREEAEKRQAELSIQLEELRLNAENVREEDRKAFEKTVKSLAEQIEELSNRSSGCVMM
ncbi:hypothetical protein FS749_002422 [Ceratobasidium sp. UAMH 11750]|nr:hypothetical protein FS749_002422 [Ceratobasidium sp. UAMH 11750]